MDVEKRYRRRGYRKEKRTWREESFSGRQTMKKKEKPGGGGMGLVCH